MSDAPALAGIQTVDDIQSADDFTKKHMPYIEVDRSDDVAVAVVTVKVGYWVSHPNMPDHFIEWIEIHANGVPVARYDMAAVVVAPEVTCRLAVDEGTTLTVLESCNLHGVWANEAVI